MIYSTVQSTASGTGLHLTLSRDDREQTVALGPVYSESWCHAPRRLNWSPLVQILLILFTFLSVNVTVAHLLPIPGLDGGHLLFLAVEGIRREPVKGTPQTTIIAVSLLVFLGFLRTLVIPCISHLIRETGGVLATCAGRPNFGPSQAS
jgi:Zn-dependent protease